ncbi:MAG TPA: choice-of-anchor B family protein [Actinomycetota bacterium]|nr:choice-of-anchor B family protein [Actinomycetota bacterium]
MVRPPRRRPQFLLVSLAVLLLASMPLAPPAAAQPSSTQGPIECTDGFAGVYPCQDVDLLSFIPNGNLGGGTGNDVWGWTDPLTGKEYAIAGLSKGTAFVDVSDPSSPVVLGVLPTHTKNSWWRDMKVYEDHAFIVADFAKDHGMQIFDLTQLRAGPSSSGLRRFTATARYAGFGSAHNVAINEETGFAYAVGSDTCGGGLHMVDIGDPTNPAFAGCYEDEGYTHDVQCVVYQGPDERYTGHEICFASNPHTHEGNAVSIVDVTDKTDPTFLGRATYPGSSYSHQGWLTEDQATFVHNDEGDELSFGHNTRTRFFDVSDLSDPRFTFFEQLRTPAIDHNLFIVGDHVFEANYTAGLQILEMDLANQRAPEVAYFDIMPGSSIANYNGAWSNYPFFDSGVVLVQGIEQGLFVLQPNLG